MNDNSIWTFKAVPYLQSSPYVMAADRLRSFILDAGFLHHRGHHLGPAYLHKRLLGGTLTPMPAGNHFIDRHKQDLIDEIKNVDPVIYDLYRNNLLTGRELDYIMRISEPEDRMRRLYDIIRYCDDSDKEKVYDTLYKYNPRVIEYLKKPKDPSKLVQAGDHFIDRHKQDLINGIKIIRPVIYDLYRNNLLTEEEMNYMMRISGPEDRMRRLYDIIRYCDDSDKEKVYDTLYKYNPRVMKYLKKPKDPSKLVKTGDHFIDRHKQDLIDLVKIIRPVISDLYRNNLLTEEERDYIMEISGPEDRMRRLYDIIRYCDDSDKEKIYDTLYKYNPRVMEYLKKPKDLLKFVKTGDHFIDRHKQDLINGIKIIHPVIYDLCGNNLLTREELDYIMEISEPEDRMRRLYDIIRYCDDSDKEKVYETLYKYNPRVIEHQRKLEDPSKFVKTGNHFINRHKQDLIYGIKIIRPVIYDLYRNNLLTGEERDYIMRISEPEDRMRRLYDIIRYCDDSDKEKVYDTLYKYNPRVVDFLKKPKDPSKLVKTGDHFIDRHKQNLIEEIKIIYPVIYDLYKNNLLTEEERDYIMEISEPEDRMRRLYDIIRYCDDSDKEKVYDTLYKYNPRVMEYLKKPKDLSRFVKTLDHIIDRHKQDLINGIKIIYPVIYDLCGNNLLTEEERHYIMEISQPADMMRRLYYIVRYCDNFDKEKVYETLYKYNPSFIKHQRKLEDPSKLVKTGDHFIDRHKQDLIDVIKNLDPVISDLYGNDLLTEEERDYIMRISGPEDRMRRLYDIIRYCDDSDKEKIYDTLYKYNPRVLEHMKKPKDPSKLVKTGDHFIDRHEQDLIEKIKNVDPVIHELYWYHLLTEEERHYIMEISGPEEKMRCLYDIIRYCDDSDKEKVYDTLYEYNPRVMEYLKKPKDPLKLVQTGDHFIDRHDQDLIDGIKNIRPVIYDLYRNNLLTEEERDYIMEISEPEDRMRRLYYIVRYCDDSDKEKVYETLYKYNPRVIKHQRKLEDPSKLVKTGNHFIDRHEQDLIGGIKNVDPVIYDLYWNNLLTEEERDYIMRISDPEYTMRRLYDIIRYCDDSDKEKVYDTLYKYNPRVMEYLKKKKDTSRFVKKSGQESEKPSVSDPAMKKDNRSSKLCDKLQDLVEVITPTMAGDTYSLSMDSPGLFRCSESGIQFQVSQPVTIEYEVDSWSNYTEILQNLRGGYQIIGPLFNIKSGVEPNVVSTVFLPHCLYLKGFEGDKSLIRCFHYKDDNMILETPSRMEPMYAVLENPTFSPFGILLYPFNLLNDKIMKLIPCEGMALLFCNTIIRRDRKYNYRLHLYLLPRIQIVEKVVVNTESSHSFQRIHKPSLAESVYHKKKYRIHVLRDARVIPKTLLFESHCPSEIYPFTEISIEGETDTAVKVSIHPEDGDVTVWETEVSADEMLDLSSAISGLTITQEDSRPLQDSDDHFLDIHRGDLISMTTMVDPVLDDLRSRKLLTREHYNTVRSKSTNQEKMRELYDYISSWRGVDKDKAMKSLRRHNPSLRVWR
ncbi:uncharacterized protein LOC130367541 isoform X3 [Hyla sarda]|uniref:uncharacterized protein LOC130367541 isoform X3 n=1 Tax=Hyla sarda TaxID=327740 RepID=UPI0024C34D1A|nr:uncharacterized protein LOC130367541 isoform X3 [Hyla sarda]